MRIARILLASLLALLALPSLYAQEKQATEATSEPATQVSLKVQTVLTEYDGTKKIASLPYMMPITLSPKSNPNASVRIGVRVPVSVSSKTGENSVQYIDVGTNLDCRVRETIGGKYILDFGVERSSLYVAGPGHEGKEWVPGEPSPGNQPLLREFRGSFVLALRDGQTSEATVATDPVSGHVLKIEATLNVVK
ncbi:MAG: hypothetical protein WBP79_11545 [Candidatus Acidiferrales bacterium]